MSRPKILAVSYTVDPGLGSEPGAAWGVVDTLAQAVDVDVLVPPHEYRQLEHWRRARDESCIRFIEARPSKYSVMFWFVSWVEHITGSWFPKFEFLTYLLWLPTAKKVGLAQEQRGDYAAAIHVAYGCYWLPSPVVDFKSPSIWGPVGGATRTPKVMWRYLGTTGVFGEVLKYVLVRALSHWPSTRRTWRMADFRIAETPNTRRAMPLAMQADMPIINRAGLQRVPARPASAVRKPYILFPSHLHPCKGPRLAIHALHYASPQVKLVFVADGMERRYLGRLARRLGVAEQVEFRGRIKRVEMFDLLFEASAVALTGMREEGGCSLSEAMQSGTPVIVLAVGGAELLAKANTDSSRVVLVQPLAGEQTAREIGDAMTRFVEQPHPDTSGYLDRQAIETQLLEVVKQAIDCRRSDLS